MVGFCYNNSNEVNAIIWNREVFGIPSRTSSTMTWMIRQRFLISSEISKLRPGKQMFAPISPQHVIEEIARLRHRALAGTLHAQTFSIHSAAPSRINTATNATRAHCCLQGDRVHYEHLQFQRSHRASSESTIYSAEVEQFFLKNNERGNFRRTKYFLRALQV